MKKSTEFIVDLNTNEYSYNRGTRIPITLASLSLVLFASAGCLYANDKVDFVPTNNIENIEKNWGLSYESHNLNRIRSKINSIKLSAEIGKADYETPSDAIIRNIFQFLNANKEDLLLKHCTVFIRQNGTFLLQWHKEKLFVTVNIDECNFSYAFVGKGNPKFGDEKVETSTISTFYHSLTKFLA